MATMPDSARRRYAVDVTAPRVVAANAARRAAGGLHLLPFVPDKRPGPPATNAAWAWSVRRLARAAVWTLPAYAAVLGVVAVTGPEAAGALPYRGGRPFYLLGWTGAVWLGLVAMVALAGLLAATRSRRSAVAGLAVGLAGAVLMLPFAGLTDQSPAFGAQARGFALAGAAAYTAGWLLVGWAVLRSGVFSYGDGVMVMLAAPLIGVAGVLRGSLQPFGAILLLTAGIGIIWRAGRLVPQPAAVAAAGDGGGRAIAVAPAGERLAS